MTPEGMDLGQTAQPSESGRPDGSRGTRTGMWNFADALELGGEARPEKSRDDKSGVFETPRGREGPRGTGERRRMRSRGGEDGGEERASGSRGPREREGTRGTGERSAMRSRTMDGEPRPTGSRRSPEREGTRGTGERSAMRSRTMDGEPRPTGSRRSPEQEGMRGTGQRPALRPRAGTDEMGGRMEKPAPKTGERPGPGTRLPATPTTPAAPGTPAELSGDVKSMEELLPSFPEAIGQEALAHHFAEELQYLSADLRPARLPRSTRAQRLWAFFLAYAEANARDPAGKSPVGRERFQEALKEHGFSGLLETATGKDGVEVALELLDAHSPEELQALLANIHMEARPEVHAPEQPAAEAPPPHTEQPTAEAAPEKTPSQAAEPKNELHTPPRDPKAEAERKPTNQASGFDQKEPEKLAPSQLPPGPPTPGMPQGMIPPGALARPQKEGVPQPEDGVTAGHDRRGTNKRLGSHMLWNVMHGFRDAPENDAVKREKWSQLAFGAIAFLMGAALLVAMLASL